MKTTLNFNVRTTSSENPTPVYAIIRPAGERVARKIKIGYCLPKYWHSRSQSAITTGRISESIRQQNSELNEKIASFANRYKMAVAYCSDHLDADIMAILTDKETSDKGLLVALYEAAKAIDNREGIERALNAYKPYLKKGNVSDISKKWWVGLLDYAKTLKHSVSYYEKNVRCLHQCFRRLAHTDIISSDTLKQIESVDYKIKDVSKSAKFFLYDEEVEALYRLNLTGADKVARDLFVFQCVTGVRSSDLHKIKIAKEGSRYVTELVEEKTKGLIRCELLFKYALEIWQNYEGKLPKMANTSYNRAISKIAKAAGLNRTIASVKQTTDGKKEEKYQPVWEIISPHIGRHTFDALLRMRKYSVEDICRYSGHNEQNVKRYTERFNATIDIDHYESCATKLPMLTGDSSNKPISNGGIADKWAYVNDNWANGIANTTEDYKEVAEAIKMGRLSLPFADVKKVWEIGYQLGDAVLVQRYQLALKRAGYPVEVMDYEKIWEQYYQREARDNEE